MAAGIRLKTYPVKSPCGLKSQYQYSEKEQSWRCAPHVELQKFSLAGHLAPLYAGSRKKSVWVWSLQRFSAVPWPASAPQALWGPVSVGSWLTPRDLHWHDFYWSDRSEPVLNRRYWSAIVAQVCNMHVHVAACTCGWYYFIYETIMIHCVSCKHSYRFLIWNNRFFSYWAVLIWLSLKCACTCVYMWLKKRLQIDRCCMWDSTNFVFSRNCDFTQNSSCRTCSLSSCVFRYSFGSSNVQKLLWANASLRVMRLIACFVQEAVSCLEQRETCLFLIRS